MFKKILRNEFRKINSLRGRPEEMVYAKGRHKIKFDLFFEYLDTCIIIEIENQRTDPVTNVIKTIFWLDWSKKLDYRHVVFLHLFNSKFNRGEGNLQNQVEYCQFLANRYPLCVKNPIQFRYRSIFIDFSEKRNKEILVSIYSMQAASIVKRVKRFLKN